MTDDMDAIYRRLSPGQIPWDMEEPPGIIVRLVESGRIEPGRAVDFGCGTGNYAIWLAGQGFSVTGIDLSPTAVALARKKAAARGVACRFVVADVLGDLREVAGPFDVAVDWELLHHIAPDDRPRYVSNVARLLRPGGTWLSFCFHVDDPGFGGTGRVRKSRIGTTLYFSTVEELSALFGQYFRIHELRQVIIPGKWENHVAVCGLMERKGG